LLRYIISRAPRAAADDDAAEGATNHAVAAPIAGLAAGELGAAAADARDGGGAQRTARGGKRGRKDKGANKGRRWAKVHDELNLCWRVAAGRACEFGAE
jgi:tRNA-dihydrouridine synthase 3